MIPTMATTGAEGSYQMRKETRPEPNNSMNKSSHNRHQERRKMKYKNKLKLHKIPSPMLPEARHSNSLWDSKQCLDSLVHRGQ